VLIVRRAHRAFAGLDEANLRSIYAGSETNVQVKKESEIRTPTATAPEPAKAAPAPNPNAAMTPAPSGATNPAVTPDATAARVRFEPGVLNLKVGQRPWRELPLTT